MTPRRGCDESGPHARLRGWEASDAPSTISAHDGKHQSCRTSGRGVTATVVAQDDGDALAPWIPELGSVDARGRAFLPGTAEHPFGFHFQGVPGEVVDPGLTGLPVGVRQDPPGDGVKVQAGAKGKLIPVGSWDLLGNLSVVGSPDVVMSGLLGDIPADRVTVLGNDKAVRKAEEIVGVEFIVNGDILSGSEYGLGLSWDPISIPRTTHTSRRVSSTPTARTPRA